LTFDHDGGVCITQSDDPEMEVGPSVFFQVYHKGRFVNAPCLIGISRKTRETLQFHLLSVQNMVVLYEDASPNEIVAIYDLDSGECWPYERGRREHWQLLYQRGEALVARLQDLTGNKAYELSGWPASFEDKAK
jgi:hypothetical protein